ncbi:MAG TPA: dienelactone hydrolase family protein [Candidatus Acidoferrales bacterium]|nr:dienelactone hydrolase family protein [Candidatus Acidoferrales bacterium]
MCDPQDASALAASTRLATRVATLLTFAIVLAPAVARAAWVKGEFDSGGKPVTEFHCAPTGAGPFPVVIMLHGAGPRGAGNNDFEDWCTSLAEHGYYTEFIEYYSQTGETLTIDEMAKAMPTCLDEIHSGIDALRQNPAVDSKRVALMGFSLGAILSLSYAATYPGEIAAIVEYYGFFPKELVDRAATLPPILILHGTADRVVPVSAATDLDALLSKQGRPHEIEIYPRAQHAFNFPDAPMYDRSASEDAWDRAIKFLDTYLKK